MQKKIAIIGAGICGISTAYLLSMQGYDITVIAAKFSPDITSNRAAAFWFPYHVRNDQRGNNWCRTSYDFYLQHCSKATGISIIQLIKAVKPHSGDEDSWLSFMPEGTCRTLPVSEIPKGYALAYEASVPLIETQIFLPWLYEQLTAAGAVFIREEVNNLDVLTNTYDLVINSSGLGARSLCNDETTIPVRGQVVLLEPGFPSHIFLDNQTPAYIVPRKDATIVGGTYEENIYTEKTEQENLDDILARATSVFTGLENRKIIGSWAGLRPYRPAVRLEREPGKNIIHNYGHGGSGYTLAFGCAAEVSTLANEVLQ